MILMGLFTMALFFGMPYLLKNSMLLADSAPLLEFCDLRVLLSHRFSGSRVARRVRGAPALQPDEQHPRRWCGRWSRQSHGQFRRCVVSGRFWNRDPDRRRPKWEQWSEKRGKEKMILGSGRHDIYSNPSVRKEAALRKSLIDARRKSENPVRWKLRNETRCWCPRLSLQAQKIITVT